MPRARGWAFPIDNKVSRVSLVEKSHLSRLEKGKRVSFVDICRGNLIHRGEKLWKGPKYI